MVFISLIFLLSSCSLLSPVPTDSANTYLLNSTPCVSTRHNSHISLLVMPVTASPLYNTTQMAYTTQAYQISYFAKNRWANTPPQMLQTLIVQTLQNTHYFRAVDAPPTIAQYDYALNTQLLELQQVFIGKQSFVRLRLRAQLISMTNNRIVASKEFCVDEPAMQNTPYAGVIAANTATNIVLRELAYFCTSRL